MNRNWSLSLGALLALSLTVGCGGDDPIAVNDDDGDGGLPTQGAISFTIDGTVKNFPTAAGLWTASFPLAIVLVAGNPTQEGVTLNVPKQGGSTQTTTDFGIVITTGAVVYSSATGEVTITVTSVTSNRVIGTFSGTVKAFATGVDAAITNGQFNLAYTSIS